MLAGCYCQASSSGADLGLKTLLPVEENVSLPDQVKNLKIEGDVDLPEAVPLDASLNGTNSHGEFLTLQSLKFPDTYHTLGYFVVSHVRWHTLMAPWSWDI